MFVKVMTDEQMEILRKQIAVYATICEQLVDLHKSLTSHHDLPGFSLFLTVFKFFFFFYSICAFCLCLCVNLQHVQLCLMSSDAMFLVGFLWWVLLFILILLFYPPSWHLDHLFILLNYIYIFLSVWFKYHLRHFTFSFL